MSEAHDLLSIVLKRSEELANVLTLDEVNGLVSLLSKSDGTPELSSLGLSGVKSRFVAERLRGLDDDQDRRLLVSALRHMCARATWVRPEICYTGPTSMGKVRVFESVITEELYMAKSRIIIIGFHITQGSKGFMKALGDAAARGVELVFMIDRLSEKADFLEWCKGVSPAPTLFTREKNSRDPMSALHAKCIVIDDRAAIIGSANQTYHGLTGNIELGVVLRDPTSIREVLDMVNEIKKVLTPYRA